MPHVSGVRLVTVLPSALTSPCVQSNAELFSCIMQRSAHDCEVTVVRFDTIELSSVEFAMFAGML